MFKDGAVSILLVFLISVCFSEIMIQFETKCRLNLGRIFKLNIKNII